MRERAGEYETCNHDGDRTGHLTVLVVDDHPINRELLRFQLEAHGHRVFEVSDGVAALVVLRQERIDAVISDLVMPRMDGYRLCSEVRRDDQLARLPFIIYTATFTSKSDEDLALAVGADKYLRKPAEMNLIIAALHEACRSPPPLSRTTPSPHSDTDVMKHYSEGLINKLEQSNAELAAALALLKTSVAQLLPLRESIEGMLEGIQIIDHDWRYLYVNAAAARQGGLTSEDHVGRTVMECYPGMAGTPLFLAMVEAKETRSPRRLESAIVFADGTNRWLEVSIEPDPRGLLIRSIDITERRRAEVALRDAQTLQDAIFNSARFSSIATDAKGVIQIFNVGAENMLGYAASDVVNTMTPADISDPDELVARASALSIEFGVPIAPGIEALVFKASRGIEDIYELTYVRKDGARVPALVSVTALRDDREDVIGYLLIGTDNTARKIAEEARRASEARYRTLFEYAPDGIVIADAESYYVDANASMCRMLGYSRDELIGLHASNIVTAAEIAQIGPALRTIKTETDYRREWQFRRKDGSVFAAQVLATQMPDGNVLAMIHDVSESKRYEDTLRRATHIAEQASRAKSDFLANMSHEIRTPMNAVIGLSYLLEQTSLTAEQASFLGKITVASKSLLGILNNVLDLSKIEAGELIVENAAFSLRDLLRDLAEVMPVQAHTKGIDFEIDAPAFDLPDALHGDAPRLHQILTNLLSNAIKFTERGIVRLRVHRVADGPGCLTLSFTVQDTGIGIAPEVQAQLFAPFTQADASITRRFGGTGLGLSIVKRLATLMGGRVTVASTPGVGSEFQVVLDFALAAPGSVQPRRPIAAPASEHALLDIRVLVVDDSDINRDVTKRILELEGAKVWLANDGEQAFDLVQAMGGAFDVVLMDIQMPELDGHGATRRIRRDLGLPDLPILALTGGALSSERARAIAAGMDDFIIKPFEPRDLVATVLRHLAVVKGRPALPIGVATQVPPAPAIPWPEIEGIDSRAARACLRDDAALYRSMLKRLLDEFGDLPIPASGDGVPLSVHGARMHKLRGGAAMLGAKAIQQLARDAETACEKGSVATAAAIAAQLGAHLRRLRENATPMLDIARAVAEEQALSSCGVLDPQDLAELLSLLREQNLSALDRFSLISPQLRLLLRASTYEIVRKHVENLQFRDAADALEAEQV